MPLNRQSATTATYVYDCKITAWCLHEPMYFEYASFPTSGNNTAARTQVPHTWGESSVDKSPSVIRRYSHQQSHHTNEYLSNICLEERLGANDNPRERVFEGSVSQFTKRTHPLQRSALDCMTTDSLSFLYGRHIGRLAYNRFRQLATRDWSFPMVDMAFFPHPSFRHYRPFWPDSKKVSKNSK